MSGKLLVSSCKCRMKIAKVLVTQRVISHLQRRRVATYRKLRKVSSRVPKKKSEKEKEKKGKKRSKRKKRPAQFVKKDDPPENATCHCRKCECNGAPCCASGPTVTMMFTSSKRPRPTIRYPPIDSSLVNLAVSEYISLSLCVFSGQVRVSSHVNQQEHVKQLLSLVSCIQKCYPSKNFRGSAPNPAGGLNAPQTPTCKAPPFTAGYAPQR